MHKIFFVFHVHAVGQFGDRVGRTHVESVVQIERKGYVYGLTARARDLIHHHVLRARNKHRAVVTRGAVFERHRNFPVLHIEHAAVFFHGTIQAHVHVKIAQRQRIAERGAIVFGDQRILENILGVAHVAVVHFLAHVFQFIGNVLQNAHVSLPPVVAVGDHYHFVGGAAVHGRADHAVARGDSFPPSGSPPSGGHGKLQCVFGFANGCHGKIRPLSIYFLLFESIRSLHSIPQKSGICLPKRRYKRAKIRFFYAFSPFETRFLSNKFYAFTSYATV